MGGPARLFHHQCFILRTSYNGGPTLSTVLYEVRYVHISEHSHITTRPLIHSAKRRMKASDKTYSRQKHLLPKWLSRSVSEAPSKYTVRLHNIYIYIITSRPSTTLARNRNKEGTWACCTREQQTVPSFFQDKLLSVGLDGGACNHDSGCFHNRLLSGQTKRILARSSILGRASTPGTR